VTPFSISRDELFRKVKESPPLDSSAAKRFLFQGAILDRLHHPDTGKALEIPVIASNLSRKLRVRS
jgi:hypothetical protein